MMKFKFYGREYCSLCHVMRDQLQVLAHEKNFSFAWIDIEDIDELELLYGELVPVLTDDSGVEICHYYLDRSALDVSLAKIS